MIYLIKHDAISNRKILHLLKIGYTEDNNFNTRMAQYKLHNPTFSLLLTVDECDDKIEKALHRYFREYLYNDYGKEWFNYNEKIVEFFKKYNTKELLEKKLEHFINYVPLSIQEVTNLYKNIKKVVNRWLCLVSSDIDSLHENSKKIKSIISDCKKAINKQILFKEDIITYLVKQYNIPKDIENDLLDYISGNIKLSQIILETVDNINSLDSFHKRLKYLCTTNLTKEERDTIINFLPLTYKKYYETLGPARLKALNYDISKIIKEYQATLFNKDNLKVQIYFNYQEGQRYSRNSLKEDLQKLYDSLNYTKKAKASDIEEYFEIKECKVLNSETGKYDRGYELIKKRD